MRLASFTLTILPVALAFKVAVFEGANCEGNTYDEDVGDNSCATLQPQDDDTISWMSVRVLDYGGRGQVVEAYSASSCISEPGEMKMSRQDGHGGLKEDYLADGNSEFFVKEQCINFSTPVQSLTSRSSQLSA